jgi:MFS family permease
VLYSLVVVFSLSYLTTLLGLSRTLSLTALSIGCVASALSIPLAGDLSDRKGRRLVYSIGAVLGVAWVFAFFPLLQTREPLWIVVAIVIAMVIHGLMYGPQAAFIAEQFPTRVRYAGASLAYTFAGIVGGGIAPLVFAALFKWKESTLWLSAYAALALLITLVVLAIRRGLQDA